jgi:hypothetical protein
LLESVPLGVTTWKNDRLLGAIQVAFSYPGLSQALIPAINPRL